MVHCLAALVSLKVRVSWGQLGSVRVNYGELVRGRDRVGIGYPCLKEDISSL